METIRDPYDDQLRAARYHAERDQAREELARIKRGDPVTHRTYDTLSDEDRKILWWVRARGGLQGIKRQRKKSVPREAYERKRAAWRRHIRECEAALRKRNDEILKLRREIDERRCESSCLRGEITWMKTRLMPAGYEWDDRFAGAVEFFEAMHDLLYTVDCEEDHDGPEMVHEVMWRLMPERYGWPRFEDGEFVKLNDDVADKDGNQCQVYSILFNLEGDALIDAMSDSSNEPILISARDGARVKRPAPEALDACGMPISRGMDVWWICEGDDRGVHAERLRVMRVFDDGALDLKPYGPGTSLQLESTEVYVEKPVLAFDGWPLRVGDTVYSIESGTKYEVCEVKLPRATVEYLAAGIPAHSDIVPSLLTHRAPVLAADGKPLREGETVYGTGRTQHEFKVRALNDPNPEIGNRFSVRCFDMDEGDECWCDPRLLTHKRPETDSWERLEEDATLQAAVYCELMGIEVEEGCSFVEPMSRDLVRRARALAGRSEK